MDISIKWKLFASFSLSMLMPLCAYGVGASPMMSIICGLVTILLLTWYSYYRILNALSTIRDNLRPLYEVGKEHPGCDIQDELTAAMLWSDRLMESVEASVTRFTTNMDKVVTYKKGNSLKVRGRLSSGDSVVGKVLNHTPLGEAGFSIPHFDVGRNQTLFYQSIASLKERLRKMRDLVIHSHAKGIVDFQIYFLDDPNFIQGFLAHNTRGLSLESSLESLFLEFVQRLEKVSNELVRSRVKDLLDLKYQVLQEVMVMVSDEAVKDHIFQGKVLLVNSLMPSQVLRYHRGGVVGIISREGTPSSHAQILLESLGIPSISDIHLPTDIPDEEPVMLDVIAKKIIFNADEKDQQRIREAQLHLNQREIVGAEVGLKSGEPILVKANLNMAYDADKALHYGADGIGLFRSEIAYLGMRSLPMEEELFSAYEQITEVFKDRPVTFRMLDIGGDKLVGANVSHEENPCMGNRSMRLLNSNPELFRSQYRAMSRAAHDQTSIIFPMVNGVDELDNIMTKIEAFEAELKVEGLAKNKIRYGIMVEVPSIVERFEDIVHRFDIYNIGTNDLTQYTLAADRNNQDVASYYSSFHPAILSMIEKICRLGQAAGKEVCLCGEVASDLSGMPLWLGLGVKQFSVPYRYVPALKKRLRELDMAECKGLATKALGLNSAKKIKEMVVNFSSLQLEKKV
jgi:phosphoenolpyruvate-protein phosphotransferase